MRLSLSRLAIIAAVQIGCAGAADAGAIYTGYIEATDARTSVMVGYVRNSLNTDGEYGLTRVAADQLLVTFDASAPVFSITALNSSNTAHPFFGGIVGYSSNSDDLGTHSANYVFLGATDGTAAGAAPSAGSNSFTDATGIARDIESAIWSLSASDALTAHWVNDDLSTPKSSPDYIQNVLLVTGDPRTFSQIFGSAEGLRFTFIPTTAVPEPASLVLLGVGLGGLLIVRRRARG